MKGRIAHIKVGVLEEGFWVIAPCSGECKNEIVKTPGDNNHIIYGNRKNSSYNKPTNESKATLHRLENRWSGQLHLMSYTIFQDEHRQGSCEKGNYIDKKKRTSTSFIGNIAEPPYIP